MTEHESTRSDDVVDRLDRLGRRPVEVSASRLDATWERVQSSLGADQEGEGGRLAVAIGPDATGDGTLAERRGPARGSWWVAAACLVGLVVGSMAFIGSSDDGLVVADAVDAVLVLPDGERLVATDGTELADGSVLDVAGFVEVGDRRYGPGRYRVEDGRLVPIAERGVDLVTPDEEDARTSTRVTAEPPSEPAPIPTDPTLPPEATRPAPTRPPGTTPVTTTPTRTTVPNPTVPNRTTPATTVLERPPPTEPAPTRPRATEPDGTVVRPSTTEARPTTTSTASTTTTTSAPVRPSPDGRSQGR